MITLTVATPRDFRFRSVVESQGWNHLAPFSYDREQGILHRRQRLSDGQFVFLRMQGSQSRSIIIEVTGGSRIITSRQRNEIMQTVKRIFNLNWDLRAFYKDMSKLEAYQWVDEHKAARLLAAPTVWEDLAKTLLTTNVSWSNTIKMAEKLTQLDPEHVFPTPQTIAALDVETLKEKTGMGYRAPYLHALASVITNGEVDVESWRNLESNDLYKAVMDLTGFGDYAAGTVLRLMGHFDKLAIDSVARNAYEAIVGHAPESDTDIRDHYEQYGTWRGLVLWMDCIRDNIGAKVT